MKYVWLDVDSGHDDTVAILLAVHSSDIKLLGISTVHGNFSPASTTPNVARCLRAYGAPKTVKVYPGATKPLTRPAQYAPKMHGNDGIGGVMGLPEANDPEVQAFISRDENGHTVTALEGLSKTIKQASRDKQKITVVSCGPMTNIALFLSAYPNLQENIEELVFMGGGVGKGTRSAVAEFNVLCDPEAAHIVLNAPVRKTMIPLNVTHTAIVRKQVQARLLSPSVKFSENGLLPEPATPLRSMLSTLVTFSADRYRERFGFVDGPPLHDPLTIAYVTRPEIFTSQRYRVDVELHGEHTSGETVVDVWHYRKCDDSWGPNGKNCIVTKSVDVEEFFAMFLKCVAKCDAISPLNR